MLLDTSKSNAWDDGIESIWARLQNAAGKTHEGVRGGGGVKPTISKYQKLEPLLIDYSESFLAVLPLSINHKVNFERRTQRKVKFH